MKTETEIDEFFEEAGITAIKVDLSSDHSALSEDEGTEVEELVDKLAEILEGNTLNVSLCAMANLVAHGGMQNNESPHKLIEYMARVIIGAYSRNIPDEDVTIQ